MNSSEAPTRAQLILTGIGGQGILFATRILAEAGLRRGLKVIGSETHGMSQRGGSVTSHLKIGAFDSPLVRPGTADVLIALEPHEAYRALRFIRPASETRRADGVAGGLLLINAPDGFFSEQIRASLERAGVGIGIVDASAVARKLGSPVVVNLVIIGFASADPRFSFRIGELRQTVEALSPPRFAQLNDRALAEGHDIGRASQPGG